MLEPLGLTNVVTCTSSYSGGLHLYFPFQFAQTSWELAIVVSTLLEAAGFFLTPGQLELFPNPKPYAAASPSLFNAHRLPLQPGSYLVNADFQPIWSDQQTFVQHWRFAQTRNCVERKIFQKLLKKSRQQPHAISGKAEKFINDLNAEIELGWTGAGQTNRLLGRITMRVYIFHHILFGGEPLAGQALVDQIVATARSLPGYAEWCQHQHEIVQRAEAWARCIEGSRYFHYGIASGKYKPKTDTAHSTQPNWNQRQSEAARERIRQAIADLLNQNTLPSGVTARFQALTQYGIGGASLYRHRDLWHPSYLLTEPVENALAPQTANLDHPLDRVEDASNGHNLPSLLSENGGNTPTGKSLTDRPSHSQTATGSNTASAQGLNSVSGSDRACQPLTMDWQAWADASQTAFQPPHQSINQIRQEAKQAAYIARMQQYLESGDPILTTEALAWAEVNPGVLSVERVSLPLLKQPEEDSPRHLSDLLALISVQVERLQWTRQQVGDRLWQLFGKRSQSRLDDLELAQWQLWLEQLWLEQRELEQRGLEAQFMGHDPGEDHSACDAA